MTCCSKKRSISPKVKAGEGFITSVSPGSFARRQNQYYKTDEEFLYALHDALLQEYQAVVDAAFVLVPP